MDFVSMVQFSSNWILVLACASLEALVLFLMSTAAFRSRSEKNNGNPAYVILFYILILAYSVLNAAALSLRPDIRKTTGLISALLAEIPLAAAFFYFKAVESCSGIRKVFFNPMTVILIAIIALYPVLRLLPQEWNAYLNLITLLYFLSAAGWAFYLYSRHVHKTSSGNIVLFIQLIALVVLVLTLVNDFSLNTVDFVLLPDNLIVAGLAALGIFLAVLFFHELPAPVRNDTVRNDPLNRELTGLLEDLRSQHALALEISRDAGTAADQLFSLLRDFVRRCADSIDRIHNMDGRVKENVNDIKQKLTEFIDQVSPLLQNKLKTEQSGRDVDEIRNILEEIENKGKIVSSGVVNLTSVIDSAKKNTEKSHRIILDIKTDRDNIESFSQTIDSIAGESNVLAMNAAIESANKSSLSTSGFRVVSDDLRELSSKIKGQTAEIQKVLAFLKQDLETGIRSTQKVRDFFQEIELIIENIFRLILNIVNHADVISNTVDDTRKNIGSLQDISARMEELVGKNSALTVDLSREIEKTRANFYQIGMLINKGKEIFDLMTGSVEKSDGKLELLKADREKLEKALVGLSDMPENI